MSTAAATPKYAFLAHPPQKQPPAVPLPSPPSTCHRSNSKHGEISTWAAAVQPGTPSPMRSSSQRRASCTSPAGTSFLHMVETPISASFVSTPAIRANLAAHGYTSVFVRFPTPSTPHLPIGGPAVPKSAGIQEPTAATTSTTPELAQKKSRSRLRPFRSMGGLRRRATSHSSTTAPPVPPVPTLSSAKRTAAIAKSKKVLYPAAPPLANELALMQFAGGGTLDANARVYMAAQGAMTGAGVGVAYKDAQGTFWADADEELEYEPLINLDVELPVQYQNLKEGWVQFTARHTTTPITAGTFSSMSLSPSSPFDMAIVQAMSMTDLASFVPISPSFSSKKLTLEYRKPHANGANTRSRTHSSSRPSAPYPSGTTASTRPHRRRPAPLQLQVPSGPATRVPSNSPALTSAMREFIADSFAPRVPPLSTAPDNGNSENSDDDTALESALDIVPVTLASAKLTVPQKAARRFGMLFRMRN